ncbi:MAG: single-stranded-DNA-specific exonuclease RecJ [Gammaproteobacteria bacterium]
MPVSLRRREPDQALTLPEHLHPLLQRIYRQRAIASAEQLQLGFEYMLSPDRLKGIHTAVDLLWRALQQQQKILVVSDFDADGATSCALVISVLHSVGFAELDYIVPNRFDYGYGLTPEIVELASARKPDLIITVDNGISSIDGVDSAASAGIEVLITDHHLPAKQLPAAAAIVNPNQPGCNFPSKSIAGVGVIFYLMLALRSRLREENWFASQGIAEPNLADYLDLVALGTVADVVSLDRNNRILVNEGLKRIRAGRARPGIAALLKVAKRQPHRITAADLGFALGPRLNAAGRLDDMSTGIECLLANDENSAYQLALELDTMNRDRQQIEAEMRAQAFQALDSLALDPDRIPAALCLFDERWHQGVVGILASRVKDMYHRPTIAFALANGEGSDELKGSARSIKGLHIRDVLDSVAAHHPGLLSKFGGHAMAAGLSLSRQNFQDFAAAFEQEVAGLLDEEQLQASLYSDGEVEPHWFNLETAQQLQGAGPWGQDFPEPVFDGHFVLRQQRRVGERHLKMVLSPATDPALQLDAIAFSVPDEEWPPGDAGFIDIAYRMDINEYRGRQTLQLMVERVLSWSSSA